MNVIIRVDASVGIGTGHVMRCLTLAKQLKKMKVNVSFITRELEGDLINFIQSSGFKVYRLPGINPKNFHSIFEWYHKYWKRDASEVIGILKEENYNVNLLIVDHYGLDEKWESVIKLSVKKIFVIDDLANRKHDCALLLDQNFYYNYKERYKNLVPYDCKQLLGLNFVLLREEFLRLSDKRRIRNGEIRNILVFFGGTDPSNETMKALAALILIDNNIKVNVVVGASSKHKEQIQEYCRQYTNFVFHCQVSNMAELLNEADLAIGAGGTTVWERCYLGVPSITIIVADNQVELTEAVTTSGAIINLGFSQQVSPNKILQAVNELIDTPEKVKSLSICASKLVNAQIVNSYPVITSLMEELK